jgi:hypothetical protein
LLAQYAQGNKGEDRYGDSCYDMVNHGEPSDPKLSQFWRVISPVIAKSPVVSPDTGLNV